jgi:predicted O-methyltransferase YrrM
MRTDRNRAALAEFAATLDGVRLMVEVGSWIGESACIFAPHVERLVCVDPWPDYWGQRGDNVYAAWVAATVAQANVSALRMPSVEAAREFDDASLDAVYIDALHDYESVKADILAWRPKLRPGGILAGHDYGPHAPGVVRAVDELIGKPAKVYGDTTWEGMKCVGPRK